MPKGRYKKMISDTALGIDFFSDLQFRFLFLEINYD